MITQPGCRKAHLLATSPLVCRCPAWRCQCSCHAAMLCCGPMQRTKRGRWALPAGELANPLRRRCAPGFPAAAVWPNPPPRKNTRLSPIMCHPVSCLLQRCCRRPGPHPPGRGAVHPRGACQHEPGSGSGRRRAAAQRVPHPGATTMSLSSAEAVHASLV